MFRGHQGVARKQRYGSDSLDGHAHRRPGLGHVGYYLCQYLLGRAARSSIVTDIDEEQVQRVVERLRRRRPSAPDEIYGVDGATSSRRARSAASSTTRRSPQFKCEIIAGAANNLLAEERHGDELADAGILYAPDYVINAGGLINVYGELNGWTPERAQRKAGEIYDTLLSVFELASEQGIPTYEAADRLAERRIEQVARIQRTWVVKADANPSLRDDGMTRSRWTLPESFVSDSAIAPSSRGRAAARGRSS